MLNSIIKIFKGVALALACVTITIPCSGQTNFKMSKKKGHYYINAKINGNDESRILLASSISGLIVSEESFNKLFNESQFEVIETKNHQLGNVKVTKTLRGSISIGDLEYSGRIIVVDEYDCVVVPVQWLKNNVDADANLVSLDFKKKTLDFIKPCDVDTIKMHHFNISNYVPAPAFETTLVINDGIEHDGEMTGKFTFDLGNGTPLFLFSRNNETVKFIKNNKLKRLPASDKSGNYVGQGIYAGFCQLGEKVIRDASVGIIREINIPGISGCVGPSMFNKIVIDTASSLLYYE